MVRKLLVANFKMNAPDAAWKNFRVPNSVDAVICPPFPYLKDFSRNRNFKLGAQDVFWENVRSGGAYTGEVSADMLKKLGVEYVILGHSERRKWMGETDEVINKKLHTALASGLKIILCVGESREVKKKGEAAAKRFVSQELRADLSGVKKKFLKNITIAYEPIWAIGTGIPDKPEDAANMACFIKKLLSVRVIYGGSVNSENAARFLNTKEIDGALVGAASLNPKEFKKIAEISAK
jgi:triosephosphate isomerase